MHSTETDAVFRNAGIITFLKWQLEARQKSLENQYSHRACTDLGGISSTGQLYKIVVLEGRLYYTVYLLIEDPFPHLDQTAKSVLRRVAHRSDHLTKAGVNAFVKKIQEMFEQPTLTKSLILFQSLEIRQKVRGEKAESWMASDD